MDIPPPILMTRPVAVMMVSQVRCSGAEERKKGRVRKREEREVRTICLSVVDLNPCFGEAKDLSSLHCHLLIANALEEIAIRDNAEALIPRFVSWGEVSGNVILWTNKTANNSWCV
jgi:hypothetical protein